MQGDTQAQNGWEEGKMDRVAKGNMHGAKGVRGKQWSTEPGEAGKADSGPETSTRLRSPAGCSAPGCLQGLFLGVPVRRKVWASDWPPLRQCCGPPPAPWGRWVGVPDLARRGCVDVCSGGRFG